MRMSKITRRQFLRLAAAGLGGVAISPFLAGCEQGQATQVTGASPTIWQPTPTSPSKVSETPLPPSDELETSAPLINTLESPTPLPSVPDLAVVRGGEPEELVRRALQALGGIERFVQPGVDVIIKPNICVAYHTYEYAATTNPWVVAALVKLCLEAKAGRVRVMDYPFGGSADEAYEISGIKEQVLAAGGEMDYVANIKFVQAEIPQGLDLTECEINEDVLKADLVINVPIPKDHSLAKLTLGMKNLMGVIRTRETIHWNIGQRLADLTSRIRPALTVVDAVRILTRGGPTGGNLDDVRKLDTVIASPDIIAADSYAASLFGMRPDELEYIVAGAAMGLGQSDLSKLRIEELNLGA